MSANDQNKRDLPLFDPAISGVVEEQIIRVTLDPTRQIDHGDNHVKKPDQLEIGGKYEIWNDDGQFELIQITKGPYDKGGILFFSYTISGYGDYEATSTCADYNMLPYGSGKWSKNYLVKAG